MIETALNTKLRQVITEVNNRVYPVKRPQDSLLPALAYRRVSGERTHSHQGYSGLARPRLQITVYSNSYGEAKTIQDKIKTELDGTSGTWGNTKIQSCLFAGEAENYTDDSGVDEVSVDFFIAYNE